MHTWSKVYSLKIANVDGFWTMYVSCMNHCQSNFSSLFFYFHFLLERLIVQSIWFFSCNFSSPPEYNRGSSFHRSSRRFPILRFFFFFSPRSKQFSRVRCTDLLTNRVPPMCRFTIDDHGSSLSSRATTRLSGSVSYRVGRARPFMPTDFQRRTERPLARGHPRTPRVRVRGPKWQSCSVSYVTPPRLLCFSLFSRKSLGNIYIYINI